MEMKAVSFDIGHTLIKYNNPLNWKSLYEPALKRVFAACRIPESEEFIQQAITVLAKYNTRENPREYEVGSDVIFREIFGSWEQPCDKLNLAKDTFYSFFQTNAACYDDTADILCFLQSRQIKIGALTDVAYGMDNVFSLQDIAAIREYFDAVLTSVDVGYRKPNRAGYMKLLQALEVSPSQMMYVGDEEKDIVGANSLGIVSVLIDRSGKNPNWGQLFTISSLLDIRNLL